MKKEDTGAKQQTVVEHITTDGRDYFVAQFNDLPSLGIVFEVRPFRGCNYLMMHLFDESENLAEKYYSDLVHVFLASKPLPLELFRSPDGLNGVLVVHNRPLPEEVSASSIYETMPWPVISLQWGTKFNGLIGDTITEYASKYRDDLKASKIDKRKIASLVIEAFCRIVPKLHRCDNPLAIPGFFKTGLKYAASGLIRDYLKKRRKEPIPGTGTKDVSLDDTFEDEEGNITGLHEIIESPLNHTFWIERAFLVNRFTDPAKRIIAYNYDKYRFAREHQSELERHGITLGERRIQQILREVEDALHESYSWAKEFDEEIRAKLQLVYKKNSVKYDNMKKSEGNKLFSKNSKKSFRFLPDLVVLYSKGQFFYDPEC